MLRASMSITQLGLAGVCLREPSFSLDEANIRAMFDKMSKQSYTCTYKRAYASICISLSLFFLPSSVPCWLSASWLDVAWLSRALSFTSLYINICIHTLYMYAYTFVCVHKYIYICLCFSRFACAFIMTHMYLYCYMHM